MTNREIILHCLKENTDVTCRKYSCDKPEQEGNTGECCDKCALGILEEYEREVRNKAIDNFTKILTSDELLSYDIAFVLDTSSYGTESECTDMFVEYVNKIAEQLKVGGKD